MTPLNILHVFRAPVGGLFRHVLDLTREQIARGHRVGLIADLRTGGARADDALRKIEPSLALGLTRVAMRRQPAASDIFVLAHVMRRVAQAKADVVHGHGAKGGAYARLVFANTTRRARLYAAWRQPAVRPRHAGRKILSDHRAPVDVARRPVPVRERL